VRETHMQKDIQDLNNTIHDKMENIQNLQASVKRDEDEIKRLDGIKTQLTQTLKSNDVQIASLTKDLEKKTSDIERAEKQIEAYKGALEAANDSIKKQNDDIKRQNEEMAKMSEERNEVVKKYNKMAADYNDLATKWNKQQEDLAKMATNTPAPPKK